MSHDLELTDVFLRHAHPEDQGWVMARNVKLEDKTVEYSFRNEDSITLVITHMQDPFVSKQHIRGALEVQAACSQDNLGMTVKVLLIYGRLLMNPHDTPKNITVVSVMEEESGRYQPSSTS